MGEKGTSCQFDPSGAPNQVSTFGSRLDVVDAQSAGDGGDLFVRIRRGVQRPGAGGGQQWDHRLRLVPLGGTSAVELLRARQQSRALGDLGERRLGAPGGIPA